MQVHDEPEQFVTTDVPQPMRRSRSSARWMAALLATLTMLGIWKLANIYPYVDADSLHYQTMADGRAAMKPFAFRVLGPATARLFADVTGRPTAEGFLVVGMLSGWVLLYGVLFLVLERGEDAWLVVLLLPLPFWLDTIRDYFLPDLLHAALVMVYLLLLRRRRWAWAAAMLVVMFLARESTLLIAVIAVPVLWRLVGKRAGLMQLGGTLAGMAVSKVAARHALANQHNMNDLLYMVGKVPWNTAKNVFGIILWTNTLPVEPPIRVWNVPHWLPLGGIHQVGYSAFDGTYPLATSNWFLSTFGLGTLALLYLVWRTPARRLLPRDEPYLCIAAIYGAATFLMAPMLGAALLRIFGYGWPLFLVYLPAIMPRIWRSWHVWPFSVLAGLHLITAWIDPIRWRYFNSHVGYELVVVLGANLVALWLMSKTTTIRPSQ